jgi:signal transduction histidine kinase/DNA-binding response OmpR family regulator
LRRTTVSERCLVLAPGGRDAALAAAMLREAGTDSLTCDSLTELVDSLDEGAGAVVVTEEALATADLGRLAEWLGTQEEWSDLPFVLLTFRGGGIERNPAAKRYLAVLGNVTFIERPFHPTTLISLVESALRGRRRQYEARSRLEALRASELRYRTLFNSMDEGFCIIEFLDGPHGPASDYVHVEANGAYERHAGIAHVVGQRVREMVPDEAQGWIDLYGEVLRTGTPIRFERELVATGRHLELSAFRVEPPSRRQVAVLFQDITARRKAETALRELNDTLERRVAEALAERKLLADLVEGTDAFVQVVDPHFRWLAINRSAADEFERIYGVRPKAGDSMLDLLANRPEHRDAVKAVWQRALAGEAFVEIAEFGDPERDRRAYEMKFNVLRGARGEMIGAYQFVYDVTERLRDQARLSQATAQVHEMAKLETLGQLTGGVAHDFNNLLTPITGALDLLSRSEAAREPRAARLIDGALQSAERAKTLVQRLLGFARRQSLQTRAVDIGSLIDGMRDLIASSIGAAVELRIAIDPDLPPAMADPNQLELAILNLCVNARDAMPGGGGLTVSAEQARLEKGVRAGLADGSYVRIAVADTGEGMDEATLARAIEPFFSTKEVGRGTGLGLSMVHGLAGQLGGAFQLSSTPGEGTRADLLLPVAPPNSLPGSIRAVSASHARGTAYSILLVDDEDLVRAGTAEMLRERGHDVVEAKGGADALTRLSDGAAFDIVVTDFTMPRMNGAELARRIRERSPETPVLIVTGYAGVEIDLDVPQLAKPFRQADLEKQIQALVAGSGLQPAGASGAKAHGG